MMSDDMKVSKGLEFPVVALPCVGQMPAAVEDEQEEARATKRLVIGVGGGARFGQRVTSQSL
jgi:superfamily I DNA/RNA helicase